MSGRKASEVSSVLNRANKSRNVFDENITRGLNILKEKIVEYGREFFIVEGMSISEFSIDAKKELSNEVEIVLRKYKDVEIINKKNYTSVYNEYKNKNEELDKKVRKNDKEVKKIFDSIKGKNWYCDQEYKDAEEVEKSYRKISNEKNTLEKNLNKTNGEIELLKGELQAAKKVKNQINEEIKKINEKAKNIIEIRNQANSVKVYINNEINDIDKNIAEKFLKEGYFEIVQILKEIETTSNEEIVKNVGRYEEKISNYKGELNKKYQEFLKIKSECEIKIQNLKNKINEKRLYRPMDYYKSESKAEKIGLITYLKEFVKGEYVEKIESKMKRLESALNSEEFDYILANEKEIDNLVDEAITYSKLKFDQQMKTIDVTFGIRKVMRNLGYQVEARKINGDINNGFRVVAKVGDETIDFDEVNVDEEGKIKIDIDHTENRKGNCGTTWKNLKDKFEEEGIMIQDITKNNRSVLYNSSQTKEENNKTSLKK